MMCGERKIKSDYKKRSRGGGKETKTQKDKIKISQGKEVFKRQ